MEVSPIILRSIERILVVLIGALAIYLGYSLFLHIPNQLDSQGRIMLPGGTSIYLSRVGPGVFFALFGAIVVSMSFRFQIKYSKDEQGSETVHNSRNKKQSISKKSKETYSGAVQVIIPTDQRDLTSERYSLQRDLIINMPKLLSINSTDKQNVKEAEDLIAKIKVALMEKVWDSDWGDFTDFQVWVINGAKEPPPEELRTAAAYYLNVSK